MDRPGLAAARRAGRFNATPQKARPSEPPLNIILFSILMLTTASSAGTITVQTSQQVTKALAISEKEPKSTLIGTIKDSEIIFNDPAVGLAYEVQLTLQDGTTLQGVDLGWYSRVPDRKDVESLTDDDIQQMKAVFTAGSQFFNVQEATLIKGNHDRAVMLTLQQRDSKFHSDTGDQVIWRPELWYFENHHGGWEKVRQTDRVLRRERFDTHKAYHDVVDHLKWVPELGGLKVTPSNPDLTITLPANAGVATKLPSTRP